MPSEWDLVQVELRRLSTTLGLKASEFRMAEKTDLSGKLDGVQIYVREWAALGPVAEIRELMGLVKSAEELQAACRERRFLQDPDG